MPRIIDIENVCVQNPAGKRLGRISQVLFHPTEPRAVGFAITPPAVGNVVPRNPRHVIFEALVFEEDVARIEKSRLPSPAAGEKALGCLWEETVIWRGMPVASSDGSELGFVHDAVIGKKTGIVKSIAVTGGAVSDAALGRADVGGESVVGFNGESVVIDVTYDELMMSGGAAAKSAAVAAHAKVRGERLAQKALDNSVAAAVAVRRSFKRGAARKVIDRVRDKAAELMGEDED